ncbi:hypothetical protein AB3662_44685 [Sorangium cellulosum]
MLHDGLVDEVSLLVASIDDGAAGMPSLFDVDGVGRDTARTGLRWTPANG